MGQAAANTVGFDVARVRRDFPILAQQIHGQPLAYLDNAATTQRPAPVVDAVAHYYRTANANVHRGVHTLSERATEAYEGARERVRRFLGAADAGEIVFVRGTTEGINLIAQTFGRTRVGTGDQVLISEMEHHSNIVPWQMLCEAQGAELKVAPITDRGEIDMEALAGLIGPKTRLIAVGHVSNALGTVNPVDAIVRLARAQDIPVVVDGAQATPHLPVDVQALGCDFYVCSGHKMYAPTGIGALWGKRQHLETMPPYMGGGDMILSVTFEATVYNKVPQKFEAGTPNIGGAVGLAAAIDYLEALGLDQVAAYERELLDYGTALLGSIDKVKLIGTAQQKAAVLGFVVEGVHPHDLGTVLDQSGIAVRAGHHCAQPVMAHFGVPATTRASLAVYNSRDELDRLARALQSAIKVFA